MEAESKVMDDLDEIDECKDMYNGVGFSISMMLLGAALFFIAVLVLEWWQEYRIRRGQSELGESDCRL
jgi:hypothetical protein